MPRDSSEAKKAFEEAVANCVVRSVPEVALSRMRDAPDADLLHQDGYHVGLEIVNAVDSRFLDTDSRVWAMVEELRRELTGRDMRVFLRVYFDPSELSAEDTAAARRSWERTQRARIVELVGSSPEGVADRRILRERGIVRSVGLEWKPALSPMVMPGWCWFNRPGVTLAGTRLANKHKKLRQYRTENGDHFRAYWLAIAGFGGGVAEDGGFSMLLEGRYVTEYERVFLVEERGGAFFKAHDVTPRESSGDGIGPMPP